MVDSQYLLDKEIFCPKQKFQAFAIGQLARIFYVFTWRSRAASVRLVTTARLAETNVSLSSHGRQAGQSGSNESGFHHHFGRRGEEEVGGGSRVVVGRGSEGLIKISKPEGRHPLFIHIRSNCSRRVRPILPSFFPFCCGGECVGVWWLLSSVSTAEKKVGKESCLCSLVLDMLSRILVSIDHWMT